MKTVTIEYITNSGNCKQATGILLGYCNDGDVIILIKGRKKKGMPVQFH